MNRLLTLAVLCCLAGPAYADSCKDLTDTRSVIDKSGGTWIEVTNDQYQFLRGAWSADPNTPEGLPFGDRAVLATKKGEPITFVWFIDGDRACDGIMIQKKFLEIVTSVGAGTVVHEEKGP